MDLAEDIKDFTAKDIQQYKELTVTVRDHWLKMLENDKMPDHLRLAIQMSIKQAEADLELLSKAAEDRKASPTEVGARPKIGDAAFQEELSATNEHSGQLASEESDSE